MPLPLHENYRIRHLDAQKFGGAILKMDYVTEEFYDVELNTSAKDKWSVNFIRKKFPASVTHTSEEYDFPDRLFLPHNPKPFAWGIFLQETACGDESAANLVAAIEISPEEWSKRLRVTEMWVHPRHRRKGLASALMTVVKEHARLLRYRAVILETQSCNTPAIDFYRSQGFSLIGFDSCCYKNSDIQRKEVRLEMGFFFARNDSFQKSQVRIVPEKPEQEHSSEEVCRRSFYNKYRIACNEHLFLHELRKTDLFLPQFSRLALVDGKIAGGIWYTKSFLEFAGKQIPVATFGPLCVAPEFQGCGIGRMLVEATLPLVKAAGFPGVIIFGEPDYYPNLGFSTCDKFGITTADGKNFDAFMGIELEAEGLSRYRGAKFHEINLDRLLTAESVAEFDKNFPPLLAFKRPGQWE